MPRPVALRHKAVGRAGFRPRPARTAHRDRAQVPRPPLASPPPDPSGGRRLRCGAPADTAPRGEAGAHCRLHGTADARSDDSGDLPARRPEVRGPPGVSDGTRPPAAAHRSPRARQPGRRRPGPAPPFGPRGGAPHAAWSPTGRRPRAHLGPAGSRHRRAAAHAGPRPRRPGARADPGAARPGTAVPRGCSRRRHRPGRAGRQPVRGRRCPRHAHRRAPAPCSPTPDRCLMLLYLSRLAGGRPWGRRRQLLGGARRRPHGLRVGCLAVRD